MPAACREFQAGEQHTHFLAVVHAVEHDDGRRRLGHVRRLHEQGRQTAVFVRHFHPFDIRVPDEDSRRLALDRLLAHHALLGSGVHEALAGEIIHSGAQEVVAGRHPVAPGFRRHRHFFEPRAHGGPLLGPGVGLVLAAAQSLADLIDLAERDRAVRGHALGHQRRVGPGHVTGKMIYPRAGVFSHSWLLLWRFQVSAEFSSRHRPPARAARLISRRDRPA